MDNTDKKYHRKLLIEKYPIKKEDRFLELIDDLEIRIDEEKYPESIFFFKDEKFYFEQDSKNDKFWCDYNKIWSVFQIEYNMTYYKIQSFIKDMVEKHFKMKVSTPANGADILHIVMEKHFKMKVSTPEQDLITLVTSF